jgi:hypothetical protein
MAVLNPPEALPGAAFVITKYLQRKGSAVSDDELISMLSPLHPIDPEKKSGNVFRTLPVMESLGLISDRRTVALAESFASHLDDPVTRPRFDTALRRTLTDPQRDGDDPWEDLSDSSGGRDITRALTWFLAQPACGAPLTFGSSREHDADARQLGDLERLGLNAKAVPNIEQWRPFRRWATALGLSTPCRVMIGGTMSDALEPIPVVAIAAELESIEAGQHALPEVLRRLRIAMPYLPGGELARKLQARIGAPIDPDEREGFLASSLTESLLLLEARGTIRLTSLADAEGVQVRDSGKTRNLTHVTINEVPA